MGNPGKTYSAFGGTGSPLHFNVPDRGLLYGVPLYGLSAAADGCCAGWSTMWGRCENVSDVVVGLPRLITGAEGGEGTGAAGVGRRGCCASLVTPGTFNLRS